MIRRLASLLAAVLLLATGLPSLVAQENRPAYFSQLDLTPIGNASTAITTREPAAVLVFSGEAGSADATALFNTWVNSSSRTFRGPAFGVVYRPATQMQEVLEEVLSQRSLKFPVFATGTDLLSGRQYRLMVVSKGLSYDVPGLDFAALERELARHLGGDAPAPAARETAAAIPAAPAVTPSPTPYAVATPGAAVATPAVAVPTPAISPTPAAAPDNSVRTGRYYNTRYTFTVTFPPGWTYRVSRNQDGAVANAPAGMLGIDLRAWAVPAGSASGDAERMELTEYIEEHLRLLSEQTGSRVGILQRFKVNDEGRMGLDYTYSFSRPIEQSDNRAPLVLHRGRIQVFQSEGVFKVVSAEAPTSQFERAEQLIEEFVQSFHPFFADEAGNPMAAPPAEAAASAAPAETTP